MIVELFGEKIQVIRYDEDFLPQYEIVPYFCDIKNFMQSCSGILITPFDDHVKKKIIKKGVEKICIVRASTSIAHILKYIIDRYEDSFNCEEPKTIKIEIFVK